MKMLVATVLILLAAPPAVIDKVRLAGPPRPFADVDDLHRAGYRLPEGG